MSKIKIKTLVSNLELPHYATTGSAGMDLLAVLPESQKINGLLLNPNQIECIPTGIAIELPDLYEAQIRPRSGLAAKHGITVLNSPGTIDSDYRGEIKVILINLSQEPFLITNQMKIAQIVVARYEKIIWQEVNSIENSQRGQGGFGSTGL